MLDFSSEHMAALGDAVMLVDEDTVYIGSSSWLIATTGADNHFRAETLELLSDAPKEVLVDWRILTAKEIFYEAKKFIPERGGRAIDIYVSSNRYKYQRFTAEAVQELILANENCWEEPLYRLDELFTSGAAKVQFLRPEEREGRTFAPEPTAQIYTFDLDKRMLGVNADHFKAFYEMNFSITCPASAGPPDFLGLSQRDSDPDVFGLMTPLSKIGIHKINGRELYLDIANISWRAPEEGLAALRRFTSYTPGLKTPATAQVLRHASSSLLEGVAVLRWHGLTDDQINILYEEGRIDSLRARRVELLNQLSGFHELIRLEPDKWVVKEETLLGLEKELEDLEQEGFQFHERDAVLWLKDHIKRSPG